MNLERLSIEDLEHLLINIPMEIERRRALRRACVIEELAALARARGFVLAELKHEAGPSVADCAAPVAARHRLAPVKFRHPHTNELTWSGRGRKAKWVQDWLAEGRTLEELAV